jgi:hypothetical protein
MEIVELVADDSLAFLGFWEHLGMTHVEALKGDTMHQGRDKALL